MKPWTVQQLFHPRDVDAAFAALRTHAHRLYSSSSTASPLARFAHRRRGDHGYRRDHVELPLQHCVDNSETYRYLPGEVRYICAGLYDAAQRYVETALQEPCVLSAARAEICSDLGKKSVLRVLRYPVGSGCRPHVDPGLCTALLHGSAGGLEVNTVDEVPISFTNRLGDYTTRVDTELPELRQLPAAMERDAATVVGGGCEDNALDRLPHWEPVVTTHSGEAVLMSSNMLGVISGGMLPGVLHRVRQDWGRREMCATDGTSSASWDLDDTSKRVSQPQEHPVESAVTFSSVHEHDAAEDGQLYRFNIIVELRPAQAKHWYAMSRQTTTPATRLRGKE